MKLYTGGGDRGRASTVGQGTDPLSIRLRSDQSSPRILLAPQRPCSPVSTDDERLLGISAIAFAFGPFRLLSRHAQPTPVDRRAA